MLKKLIFLSLFFIPSFLVADDFTVSISTNSISIINRITPNTQAYLQAVINRSIENLKDEIIRRRLSNPTEKQRIIDSILSR